MSVAWGIFVTPQTTPRFRQPVALDATLSGPYGVRIRTLAGLPPNVAR
jgi:hypothetical protein